MNNRIAASFLIFSIVISSSAFALPCAFFGTVRLDGNAVSGATVTAHLNSTGALLATGQEINSLGNYTVTIDSPGSAIFFKISGLPVDQAVQSCLSGKVSPYLNLTASTLLDGSACSANASCTSGHCVHNFCRPNDPFVGDGFCDQGESCLNSQDCSCTDGKECDADGNCVAVQKIQGGGGSGGGGGPIATPKPTATPTLEQIATNGGTTSSGGTVENATDTTQGQTETAEGTTGNETQGATMPLTGMFLGLSTFDWLTAILAGIVVGTIMFLYFRKRKKKSKK